MEKSAPTGLTFKAGSYKNRWIAAKKAFKATTGKKKPAPSKQDQGLWAQMHTLDDRQATKLGDVILTFEKALLAFFKSANNHDTATVAYNAFSRQMKAYMDFLDKADSKLPASDQKVWDGAVSTLKLECRRIQSELKAWLAQAEKRHALNLHKTHDLNNKLRDLFDTLSREITNGELYYSMGRSKALADGHYQQKIVANAKEIQKLLVRLQRMRILMNMPNLAVIPPHALEVALDAFAAGKHKLTSENEYQAALQEYDDLLQQLRNWAKSGGS